MTTKDDAFTARCRRLRLILSDVDGVMTDGSILLRLLTEMGPVRSTKTMVRTFAVDADCKQIGSILVNDVTACTPGEPGACLDGLALSSRLQALRLYK